MKNNVTYIILLSIATLFLLACGSDSKVNADDILTDGNTLLSIVYKSTDTTEDGKMVGHYHVHAVDANSKPISGLKLKMSLINGVKVIRNQKLQKTTGRIESSYPIGFYDNNVNFETTGVKTGDSLIVLPTSGKTNVTYLGDWKILGVGAGLQLKETSYHLENTEGLTYIIGNEQRLLGATNGGRGVVSVAHIEEVNTTTDAKGFTNFDVIFDPILAGHTVTIGVHTEGNRWGASDVVTLRGGEFTASPVTVANTGHTYPVSMRLLINGTEDLIGLDISPNSFSVEPTDSCSIDTAGSDFHTDKGGYVRLSIKTKGVSVDVNGTKEDSESEECTVSWAGGAGSIYYEY